MANISDELSVAAAAQPSLSMWIAHMWQRLHDHKRLGLILGAGVSFDAGCPLWKELVTRIINEKKISLAVDRSDGLSETYVAEILFR